MNTFFGQQGLKTVTRETLDSRLRGNDNFG